jgi:hypothetical protein
VAHVTYSWQLASAWQASLMGVAQAPATAVLRQVAHGSVLEVIIPGVTQYSVAHAVAQPPASAHTQFAMYWKYASLPPVQPVWQQSMQLVAASASHVCVLAVVSVHVPLPPEELPEEPPLLEPLEPPLLPPLLPPPLLLPETSGHVGPGTT